MFWYITSILYQNKKSDTHDHILGSWILFDDHKECLRWSKLKHTVFLSSQPLYVMYVLIYYKHIITYNRVLMTTYFALMTTIWWPHWVFKVVKIKKVMFFFSYHKFPGLINVCFDISQAIKCHKESYETHDHICCAHDHSFLTTWSKWSKWSKWKIITFFELPYQQKYMFWHIKCLWYE